MDNNIVLYNIGQKLIHLDERIMCANDTRLLVTIVWHDTLKGKKH